MYTENWSCVEGTNYEVSDMGNVRNQVNKKKVLPMQRNGSLFVKLHHKNKHAITLNIASLVLETFNGKPNFERDVCYFNNNKLDNRLENLYWSSKKKVVVELKIPTRTLHDCKISHKKSFLSHKSTRNSVVKKKRVAIW